VDSNTFKSLYFLKNKRNQNMSTRSRKKQKVVTPDGAYSNSTVKVDYVESSSHVSRSRSKRCKQENDVILPDAVTSGMEQVTSTSMPVIKTEWDVSFVHEEVPVREIEFRIATKGLGDLHPMVIEENEERRKSSNREKVLDMVVSTMLSQNTTARLTRKAFSNLKSTYPCWLNLINELKGDDKEARKKVEDAIQIAGLASKRTEFIVNLIKTVAEGQEEGTEPTLEHLRNISDEEIKSYLGKFKGIGPKTISCVLLFSLLRPDFPVDTHVLRISKKLKWIPSNFSREQAYDLLNSVIPDDIKMDLHCLLVTHGKHCHACAARGKPQFPPKDGSKLCCPLVNLRSQAELLRKGNKLQQVDIVVKKEF